MGFDFHRILKNVTIRINDNAWRYYERLHERQNKK